MDREYNPQHERIWAPKGHSVPAVEKKRFSGEVYTYVGISYRGVTGPFFLEKCDCHPEDKGRTAEKYIHHILKPMIQDIKKRTQDMVDVSKTQMFPDLKNWIFQQDRDSSHTAKKTQAFLHGAVPDFISKEVAPTKLVEWPIENYWNILKEEVYKNGQFQSRDGLKKAIRAAVKKTSPEILRAYFDSMPRRLQAVVAAEGGYTKY